MDIPEGKSRKQVWNGYFEDKTVEVHQKILIRSVPHFIEIQ